MADYPIDVSPGGTVFLGTEVTCDGFHRDFRARVQTHIHVDHMNSFDSSKGLQDIYMSQPTLDLLITEMNADLPIRSNLLAIEMGNPVHVDGSVLTLLSSGHMLGSVQVRVELPDGTRVGYSGDFQWPLDRVIEVDALVVDCTYGSPKSIRRYSQDEAEERFLELVTNHLRRGPVHVKANRGTVQRALQVLAGNLDCVVVGSERFCREVETYRKFGYAIDPIQAVGSEEGRAAVASSRYIRFYSTGDQGPVDIGFGIQVSLSAYMARPEDPVMEYSERSFSVALSNHADFNGTLEYLQATGARYVVTDNSRGGHGIELAREVRARLGIEARPSSSEWSYEWGTG